MGYVVETVKRAAPDRALLARAVNEGNGRVPPSLSRHGGGFSLNYRGSFGPSFKKNGQTRWWIFQVPSSSFETTGKGGGELAGVFRQFWGATPLRPEQPCSRCIQTLIHPYPPTHMATFKNNWPFIPPRLQMIEAQRASEEWNRLPRLRFGLRSLPLSLKLRKQFDNDPCHRVQSRAEGGKGHLVRFAPIPAGTFFQGMSFGRRVLTATYSSIHFWIRALRRRSPHG